jgi:hypothetical protein
MAQIHWMLGSSKQAKCGKKPGAVLVDTFPTPETVPENQPRGKLLNHSSAQSSSNGQTVID